MGFNMSGGLRFATRDFFELRATLGELGQEVRSQARTMEAALLASRSVDLLDRVAAGDLFPTGARTVDDGNFVMHIKRGLEEDWKESVARGTRNPAVDFGCHMEIFGHEGRFYGFLRTEQAAWRRLVAATPGVEPFPYWNGTDPPDGISDDEWEARGRLWSAILGPRSIPADNGLTCDLNPDSRFFLALVEPHEVLAEVPSFESRVARTARKVLIETQLKERGAAGKVSLSTVMQVMSALERWLETDDGRAALAATRADVAGRLHPAPGFRELLGWEPDAPAPRSADAAP